MNVYDPADFAGRVDTAASYIFTGSTPTRTFDTCFEMFDGDAVAVAVYRMARTDPRLRSALWRYLGRSSVIQVAFANRRRPTESLPAWAASLRDAQKVAA